MKLTSLLVVSIAVTLKFATCAVSPKQLVEEEWEAFKLEHNKVYKSKTEEKIRLKIYMENRLKITQHNRNTSSLYKLAMNQFGDILPHERNNGLRKELGDITKGLGATFLPPNNYVAPAHVDWRDHGFVTPVKDQGGCGSCWSFAAVGALEGQMKRKTGNIVSLSAQDLVDCSTRNQGCAGGYIDLAYMDIMDNNGIDSDSSYPYVGRFSWGCHYTIAGRAASDVGFVDIPQDDEEALKIAVATVGPIAVNVNSKKDGFQLYSGGIYKANDCDPKDTDHCVLIVGYGTENGQEYWLIKNSWGTIWGEHGYMKMARNNNNQCGIASSASYPVV